MKTKKYNGTIVLFVGKSSFGEKDMAANSRSLQYKNKKSPTRGVGIACTLSSFFTKKNFSASEFLLFLAKHLCSAFLGILLGGKIKNTPRGGIFLVFVWYTLVDRFRTEYYQEIMNLYDNFKLLQNDFFFISESVCKH